MFGHVEGNHPSAVMTQHHEDERDPKGSRRHGKEIDRDQILDRVVQESFPVWEGGFLLLGISRETVRSETSMSSLRSSP
jgi:hypothetical protein